MKLCVRLHNSEAGTGLLRRINLLSSHTPWRSNITMLTLVTWLHQSWHQETEMMSRRAGQTIYISITVCTRLMWPPMADAIDHSQQHCSTQWDLVVYRTDWIFLYDYSETRVSGFADSVKMPFGRKCHTNMKTSAAATKTMIRIVKKQGTALLSLLARLFFMKSIVSRPLEDYFALLSPLFLWGIEIAVVPNSLGLTFKAFPSCFPLDTVSAVWFCCLDLTSHLVHLRRTGTHPAGQRRVARLQTCTLRMSW